MASTIICEKSLKPSDIDGKLSFPTSGLRYFQIPEGALEKPFQAFDTSNKEWEFMLCIRRGRHPKLVIPQYYWRRFVIEKRLRVGDKVTFYMEENGAGLRYRVLAERESIDVNDPSGEKHFVDVETLYDAI